MYNLETFVFSIFKNNKNINIFDKYFVSLKCNSFRSSPINVDRFNFKGKICKKKTRKLFFLFFSRIFMQKSLRGARRISLFKQKTSRASHNIIQSQGRCVLSLFAFVIAKMLQFFSRIYHIVKKVFRQIRHQN